METATKIIGSFWHSLTPGLISILMEMIKVVKQNNRNCVHIQRDLALTHSQFCNLQKLRYWGLIAHYEENGQRKAGFWVLTRRAGSFLRNELEMPRKVRTLDNHLVEKSLELKKISDYYRGFDVEYWQTQFGNVNLEQNKLPL